MDLNFNPSQYKPFEGMEALPAGTYPVIIIGSEPKRTRDNSGGYLELTYELTPAAGQFAGRKQKENFNLWHADPSTAETAHRILTNVAICLGLGQTHIAQSEMMYNRPLMIRTEVNGKFSNVVGHTDMNGNDPAKPAGTAGPTQGFPPTQGMPQQGFPAQQQQQFPPAQQPPAQFPPPQQQPQQAYPGQQYAPQQMQPQSQPQQAFPPPGQGYPGQPPAQQQPQYGQAPAQGSPFATQQQPYQQPQGAPGQQPQQYQQQPPQQAPPNPFAM